MRLLIIRFFILLDLVFPAFASAVTPMAAGQHHTVALKSDGTYICMIAQVDAPVLRGLY